MQKIPHIEAAAYPPALAGPLYPEGIPIKPQAQLEELIAAHHVDECVLAYSDISVGGLGGATHSSNPTAKQQQQRQQI